MGSMINSRYGGLDSVVLLAVGSREWVSPINLAKTRGSLHISTKLSKMAAAAETADTALGADGPLAIAITIPGPQP